MGFFVLFYIFFRFSFSFIGTFQVTKTGSSGIKYFTIMDVHLRPDSAYEELLHMRYVIGDFIRKNPGYFTDTSTSVAQALAENVIDATATNKPSLKTNHPILIIGDFNADCSYISLKRQESLRLVYTNKHFFSYLKISFLVLLIMWILHG